MGVSSRTISTSSRTGVSFSDKKKKKKGQSSAFGLKQITAWGSFALLVNNITGAAIVDIPGLFQVAGWLTPVICMITFMLLGILSASMLCEAMAKVPGNEYFEGRIELTTLSKLVFPRWGYWTVQFLLLFSLQALNISAMIVSAQTLDWTIYQLFDYDVSFGLWPFGVQTVQNTDMGSDSPFNGVVISLGFVIVLVLAMPLGYFNLDDNMWVQEGAFILTVMVILSWLGQFCFLGVDFSRVPAVGPDQAPVLGSTIFNYAFVITVPSWVNELRRGVSVHRALWSSSIFSTLIYISIGVLGGLSLNISSDQDLIEALPSNVEAASSSGAWNVFALSSVYLFPPIVLLPGIPVYVIVVKYNLMESGLCGKWWANFWAGVAPWIVAVPFCTGSGFNDVVNWTSLFFNGAINFIVPLLLFMVLKVRPNCILDYLEREKISAGIIDGSSSDDSDSDDDDDDDVANSERERLLESSMSYLQDGDEDDYDDERVGFGAINDGDVVEALPKQSFKAMPWLDWKHLQRIAIKESHFALCLSIAVGCVITAVIILNTYDTF